MFRHINVPKQVIKLTPPRSNTFLQFLGGFIASIAAFSCGSIIAWSSPASSQLLHSKFPYKVRLSNLSWIVGLAPLGAAATCIPAGIASETFGRRPCLLSLIPFSLLGWGFIIWGNSVNYLYAGRFFCGTCCGISSVVAPYYVSEICQKDIKDMMDILYQFSFTCGVLFVYSFSTLTKLINLSVMCLIISLLVGGIFFFPDSPVYYLSKDEVEKARKSLRFYRGPKYDVERELTELKGDTDQYVVRLSMYSSFSVSHGVTAGFIGIGLMMFQQLSGINAIISFAEQIFTKVGKKLHPTYATIVFGVVQVLSTIGFTYILRHFGRRILLAFSGALMAFSTFTLFVYFTLFELHFNLVHAEWVPLYSLSVYIIAYSLGFGPLAWGLSEELLPDFVRGKFMPLATFFNWIFAFLVTTFFLNIDVMYGAQGPFLFFAASSLCATIFSFFLPENAAGFHSIKSIWIPTRSGSESCSRSISSASLLQAKARGISLKPL